MDEVISKLKTPEECEKYAQKCISLAREAQHRAIELRAKTYGNKGEVETELLKALYAYEVVLSDNNKRKTRASRTWQMVNRYGIIEAAVRAVNRKSDPMGYKVLVDKGLQDLTFEAVIVRFSDAFSPEIVALSKSRLAAFKRSH